MNKKFISWLSFLAVFTLMVHSCRNDHFPEQEAYNNGSKFQLTSKRISLSEAKHRTRLLTHLQKAEKEVEKEKLNVQGKLVDIGNGITIDTDEVIYMENGPDFHSYTFSVIRDHAPADAPVENLLLTPNTDGSYRVFHIVLNLTEADKAKIANREFVDYKNKSQVTELAGISLSSLSQKQMCVPYYYSYPVLCKEGLHEPGQPCAYAGTSGAAYWGTIVTYDCFEEQPATITYPEEGGSGGGGSGGSGPEGGGGQTPPDDCINIATNPGEVGFINESGCNTGVPTLPNLGTMDNDPCFKTKAFMTMANDVLHNPTVQEKLDAVLKGKLANQVPNEWSVAIGQNPDGTYDVTPPVEGGKDQSSTPTSQIPPIFVGDGHLHPTGAGVPSGGDLFHMLNGMSSYPNFKYRFVFGKSNGNIETYAFVIHDKSLAEAFLQQFPFNENYDPKTHGIKEGTILWKEVYKIKVIYGYQQTVRTSSEYYDYRAVGMAHILEKFNSGISIAKVDANGNLKKINVSLEKGGTMGEKVIVTKCP